MSVAGAEKIEAGTVVGGRFLVESNLGQGTLGRVCRASDQKTRRPVALRFLSGRLCQDTAVMERMREQVQLASRLQHKNIVRVYGLGKEGEQHYLVMEYIEGQSLRQLLDKKIASHNTFSLKGAYNVAAHLCNALHHAHGSLVHGLPGPKAILVNNVGRVKLSDFGVYCALSGGQELLTRLSDIYSMAPEIRGDPTAATRAADIYTVGVVLFELLTGQRPESEMSVPSHLIQNIGGEVDEVVRRAMQPNPAERFEDLQQLKAAFYAAISSDEAPLASQNKDDVAAWVESSTIPPVLQNQPAAVAAEPEAAEPPGAMPPAAAVPAAPAAVPSPAAQPAAAGGDPFQIAPNNTGPMAQSTPGAAQVAPVAVPATPRAASIEEMLVDDGGDSTERWLIQKDRLDFGPFALGELKQQLYKRQFSPDDMVLNKETGDVTRIRNHALLREFIVHLESHFAHKEADSLAEARLDKDKRRRTVTVLFVAMALIVLGAGGAVAAWFLTKDPEIEERIVYREKEADIDKLINGMEITWKKEPPQKKRKKRRRRPRRKSAGGAAATKGGESVTYLGDATKEGGDERLTQPVIQRVMQKNFRKLIPCFLAARRADSSLREVNIDFGIKGSGRVNSAKVNGKGGGGLQSCILSRMKTIKFPSFDGALTPASFSMSLK